MKRLLAVFLTVVLLFSSVPMVALAEMPSDFQTRFNIDKLEGKWKDSDGVEYDTLTLEYQVKGTGLASWQGAWLAIDMTKLIWVHNTKDGNSILSRIGEGKTFVPGNKEIVQFASTNFHSFREIFDEDDEPLDQWAFDAGVATGGRVSADQKTLYINPQPRQVAVDASQKPIKVDYEDFTTILSYRLAIVPGAELSTDSIRYATLEESSQSYVILMNDGASHYTYVGEGEENDFLPIPFTGTAGITGQVPAPKVDAAKPVISAEPAGASYFVGAEATPLTVTATVTDGGVLSYEWFKNTTASIEGGVSVGTGATYTPATDALGDTYYYVVITNTNEAATGAKTATATSAVAKISISVDPDVEAIEAATAALNGATWTEIAQDTANTKEDVQANLTEQAKAIVNNDKVTVTVTVDAFQAAEAGSAATDHDGEPGKATFTVKATIGAEEYILAGQEVTIIAKLYTGELDVDVIKAVKTALEAATWTPIAQEAANTKEDVLPILQEQAKAIVNNNNVTVTVTVDAFQAAEAGSAATDHDGEPGKATFTVKATIGAEEYILAGQEVTIIAKLYTGELDVDVIKAAKTALEAATWTPIAQEAANTKEDVLPILQEQAKAIVNNDNVTVTVTVDAFQAAEAGSAATDHIGKPGKAIFTVKATIGAEEYILAGQEVTIIAKLYTGELDVDVIKAAKTALEAATWTPIAQEAANTKEDVLPILQEQAKAIVNNNNVTVTVTVDAFQAAEAGSAATDHDGEPGKATFTVKATIGAEEYILAGQEVTIIAKLYTGELDVDVIKAAKTALEAATWTPIAQEAANTKEDVLPILQEQAKAIVNNDKVTVTVTVDAFQAAEAGSAATDHDGEPGKAIFTVKATIGAEEYILAGQEVTIIAKLYTGELDVDVIKAAKTALEAATWTPIAQEAANTKEDVLPILQEQAKAIVNNDNVTVTVTVDAFQAAEAGSAATDHIGKPGKAIFTVKATIGAEEYILAGQEVTIIAKLYTGELDVDVIKAAKTALEAATWTPIAQEAANTKEDVLPILQEQAKAIVNNNNVTVTVTVDAFQAAEAGSAATDHDGEPGKATFTVKATIGAEEYILAGQEVTIIAKLYTGELDVDVIKAAKTALEAATWTPIAQEAANTKEDVLPILQEQAKAIVNNDNVTVTVTVDAFQAAEAGSAATDHIGKPGKAIFTVKATIGVEECTLDNLNVTIEATRFNGVLDEDAVKAAQDTLTDCIVIVKIGADADEIREAIEKYLDSKMTGNAEGVTVTIESVTDNQYKLIMTKGAQTVEKTIEITVEEEDPIKLNTPANLVFANGIASWDAVANAVSYTVSLYEVVDGTYTLLTTANAAQNQCDFTALIQDGKYYAFDVWALGDGVYFLDSDISDFSEVYRKGNTIEQILAVLIALRNSKYAITAEAGEGGVISGEGVTKVKYGNDITYHIAAMPGYEIDRVIVDGKDVGAVSEYTFENVKKKHTITVTFKEVVWVNPFTDVSEADPFFDAVRFVYDCKLFNGISETEFAPEMSMTRAMFVTVLWRLEGMPVVNYLMQYDDVADETWYTEAIRWATAEGIVEGYGDGIFGTEDAVTVQQATVIMARYAQYAGTYTAPTANMDIFADNAEVADWAVEAMAWAVENGIYVPENGKLNPTAMAPRSLAAQFMHAYVVKFSK